MPLADNEGLKIYYEVEGSGPDLILAHVSLCLYCWALNDPGVIQLYRNSPRNRYWKGLSPQKTHIFRDVSRRNAKALKTSKEVVRNHK